MAKNVRNGIITVLFGAILYFLPVPQGLTPQAWHLFALTFATILGFMLQPLPMSVVALTGITLVALTKTLKLSAALAGYASGTIWLIVCAFMLARGFIKTGLGRRIAYLVLSVIGTSTLKVGYGLALSDLILSPATPSSGARAGGILYPIVRGLSSALGSEPQSDIPKTGGYLMQVVYQTEGIVCAMFMTSMAANPLIVDLAAKTTGVTISWGEWALASCVPGILALLVIPWLLYVLNPPELKNTPEARSLAISELKQMGSMSKEEKSLLGIFVLALILWCSGGTTGLSSTLVAMVAFCLLLIFKVITWDDALAEKGAWDTLIWMGTIVCLAGQLNKLGFIKWFAGVMTTYTAGLPWTVTLLVLVLVYMYSHYGFASLTAHISAMYAAFVAVAVAAGAPPYLTVLAMAFIANICLGITHYSGSPGPIYFGAGFMSLRQWWRIGFFVSVAQILIWVGVGSIWWKILGLW